MSYACLRSRVYHLALRLRLGVKRLTEGGKEIIKYTQECTRKFISYKGVAIKMHILGINSVVDLNFMDLKLFLGLRRLRSELPDRKHGDFPDLSSGAVGQNHSVHQRSQKIKKKLSVLIYKPCGI